jgi:hypothetical protein
MDASTRRENLLHDLIPILLSEDHPDMDARAEYRAGGDLRSVAAHHPAASWAWGALAQQALDADDAVAAYAYARTGYHRGLDALRRAGWRGAGPIPIEHIPNRGFLLSLDALALAADAINEPEEAQRCREFLTDAGIDLSDHRFRELLLEP